MMEMMEKFKIEDIWVKFPFVPYPAQEAFMAKMIESLKNGQNALLESPTGTGKTLCLLCSASAWLDYERKIEEFPHLQDGQVDKEPSTNQAYYPFRRRHRMYFCSRTHSQIMQAIQEFQNSAYGHLRSTVLGSRKHLCIHPSARESGSNLDNKCRDLRNETVCEAPDPDIEDLPRKCGKCLKDHMCPYYKNYLNMVKDGQDHPFTNSGSFDQRGLIQKCQRYGVCPFYMSRHLQKSADIIFLPYSYVFNPHILRGLQLNLRDAVIVIDEGHNLEKLCEENASFEMKISDVTKCGMELNDARMYVGWEDPPFKVTESELYQLQQTMKDLESLLDTGLKEGESKDGKFALELFQKAGFKSCGRLLYTLKEVIQFCAVKQTKIEGMRKIHDVVRTVYYLDEDESDSHASNLEKSFVLYKEKEDKYKKDCEPKIFFWCFNAGVIMNSLRKKGVHSFIVTSGTLSPLAPLKKSLEIPFQIELINQHVINDSQVLSASVASVQVAGKEIGLDATFSNRTTNGDTLYEAIGHLAYRVAKATPKGLLMFFPSGKVKKDCIDRWNKVSFSRTLTLYDAINNIKPIYEEPPDAMDLPKLQKVYGEQIFKSGGACLIGVYSGKVSEGIDFKDDLGRAVIMVGLPYPPLFDPWVIEKKKHIKKNRKEHSAADDWYHSQAIRPVNQALGRIIRHQGDWGAIIMADARYCRGHSAKSVQVINSLPAWLRRVLETVQFKNIEHHLGNFFKSIPAKMEFIKSKCEQEQSVICSRHWKELEKEECPSEDYHTLLKMRDAEKINQEVLKKEVSSLESSIQDVWEEVQRLQMQVEAQMSMDSGKEAGQNDEFNSDCESSGETEWDDAISQPENS